MRKLSGVFKKVGDIAEVKLNIIDAAGNINVTVPSNIREKYRFMTVDNSENAHTLTLSSNTTIRVIPTNSVVTFPIPPELIDSLQVSWAGGGAGVRRGRIYFSSENLNYNCYFA